MNKTLDENMFKEDFYCPGSIEGDLPDFSVTWDGSQPGVVIAECEFDRSGLNRLIGALRAARNETFGADA